MILNPNIFPNLNSNLLDLKKPQEQVEKAFCYRTMNIVLNFHCSNKLFYWFQPSASNFKSLSQSLEQLFLIVGQNNFVNKIPCLSRRERFQKENQYTGTPSTIVCRRWRSWLPEIEWKEKNRHLCRNVGRISFIDFEPCGRSRFSLRPQWKWQSTVSCHSKNRAYFKGPFIYYVSTFWEFLDPLPPYVSIFLALEIS